MKVIKVVVQIKKERLRLWIIKKLVDRLILLQVILLHLSVSDSFLPILFSCFFKLIPQNASCQDFLALGNLVIGGRNNIRIFYSNLQWEKK